MDEVIPLDNRKAQRGALFESEDDDCKPYVRSFWEPELKSTEDGFRIIKEIKKNE